MGVKGESTTKASPRGEVMAKAPSGDEVCSETLSLASSLVSVAWGSWISDAAKDPGQDESLLEWVSDLVYRAWRQTPEGTSPLSEDAVPGREASVLQKGTHELREDILRENELFLRRFIRELDDIITTLPKKERTSLQNAKQALFDFMCGKKGEDRATLLDRASNAAQTAAKTVSNLDAKLVSWRITLAAGYVSLSKGLSPKEAKRKAESKVEDMKETFKSTCTKTEDANEDDWVKTVMCLKEAFIFASSVPPKGRDTLELDGPLLDMFAQLGLSIAAATAAGISISGRTSRNAPGTLAQERDALMDLFKGTNGSNWANKSGWGVSEALGEWHGVVTDASGRVVRLSLPGNKLQGSIPKSLRSLGALRHLDLQDNELRGSIPEQLGDLIFLEYLSLCFNKLSGSIPKKLGGLAMLQHLDLQGNQLSGPIPSELESLNALKCMILCMNRLEGPIPKELGSLSALQRLNLYFNQLSGPIPEELGNLGALQDLFLGGNNLSGPIPKKLGELAALQHLSLCFNKLVGSIPEELGDLAAMRQLDLEGNKLKGKIPTKLENLKLRQLDLEGNQLKESECTRLKEITRQRLLEAGEAEAKSPPAGERSVEPEGSGASGSLEQQNVGEVISHDQEPVISSSGKQATQAEAETFASSPAGKDTAGVESSGERRRGRGGVYDLTMAGLDQASQAADQSPAEPKHSPVEELGSSEALIPEEEPIVEKTWSSQDGAIELHVKPSPKGKGGVIGPVHIRKEVKFLKHGGDFLVTSMLDCKPSGSKFDTPLLLDFRVGSDADDELHKLEADGDGPALLKEYEQEIREEYKIFWSVEDGEALVPLGADKTQVLRDDRGFFLRASIHHFSHGCLGTSVNLNNACHSEPMYKVRRTRSIEFVNATEKPVTFLMMNTSWSHSGLANVILGVNAGDYGGVDIEFAKKFERVITEVGLAHTWFTVPPRVSEVPPFPGEKKLPNEVVQAPKWAGDTVKVALITTEAGDLKVWKIRDVGVGKRYIVLPRQFEDCMEERLVGKASHDTESNMFKLAKAVFESNDIAFASAPVSTIRS